MLLIPLAITSTAKMLKRLGVARWQRLHRLAYVAGVLGVVHFVLRVKKDMTRAGDLRRAARPLLRRIRVATWLRDFLAPSRGPAGSASPASGEPRANANEPRESRREAPS